MSSIFLSSTELPKKLTFPIKKGRQLRRRVASNACPRGTRGGYPSVPIVLGTTRSPRDLQTSTKSD